MRLVRAFPPASTAPSYCPVPQRRTNCARLHDLMTP
nr:MAG TPA: hypothetical protein [Caudoviricetes sp.]DAN76479.1 MAG TPA: hypothetical protein [Caudoviricetes sp.]